MKDKTKSYGIVLSRQSIKIKELEKENLELKNKLNSVIERLNLIQIHQCEYCDHLIIEFIEELEKELSND